MGVSLAAALWGFAEATLFFIVPDVLLSFVALRRRRAALIACLFATAGALVGGALMFAWGSSDVAGAVAALDRVPAVSVEMVEQVESDLERQGLWALMVGPFRGTPYKIYAVESAELEVSLGLFLAVSIPARLIRFVLLSLIASWLSERLLGSWSLGRKRWAMGCFWVLFYTVFLLWMPS
ncbi:MAG: hypothetical protein V3T72_02335 [Thermoanaerobaculia bacterium]